MAAAAAADSPLIPEAKDGLGEGKIQSVTIPSTRTDAAGTVFYLVHVASPSNRWVVAKRYSQFEELQAQVLAEMAGKSLPAGCELPPKKFKLFTSHAASTFIEERRCLLEAYLKKVMSVEKLRTCPPVYNFLTQEKESKEEATVPAVAAAASEEDKRRSGEDRDLPDDVEITGITIPATRTMSDHVLYQIDVVNNKKRKTFSKWTVLKRFGQFYDMDLALRESLVDNPEALAGLPGPPQRKAKLFNDHMDENFVEQRRVLLENFLNRLLENPVAIRNKAFLSFLGVTV